MYTYKLPVKIQVLKLSCDLLCHFVVANKILLKENLGKLCIGLDIYKDVASRCLN